MKLQIEDRVLESSLGTGVGFSISQSPEANAMLYDLLSSKLYSNIVGTIVRELLSNAMDACAAAGTDPSTIRIQLPTSLDPTFSILDTGLGMDPQKVLDVYTVYFESTKRDSEEQIGGFGLGLR